MDQNKLLEFASYVTNLKMFPYFDAAHYVVMCLLVRDDNGSPQHSGNLFWQVLHAEPLWGRVNFSMCMCVHIRSATTFLAVPVLPLIFST